MRYQDVPVGGWFLFDNKIAMPYKSQKLLLGHYNPVTGHIFEEHVFYNDKVIYEQIQER